MLMATLAQALICLSFWLDSDCICVLMGRGSLVLNGLLCADVPLRNYSLTHWSQASQFFK